MDGLAQLAGVVTIIHDTPKRSATMPRRFADRHLHLSALAEHAEQAIGLRLTRNRERKGDALERGLAHAATV